MRLRKTNWKPLTVLTASLTLAACGGGGGGGSDPVAPAPAPSNPGSSPVTPSTPTSTTTVTGAVTKGPVAGATIELFRVDQFGNLFGDAVVTGVTTGADGSFSVQIDASITEDLIVVASGGSFVDESDTTEPRRSITLNPATDTFLSVIRPDQTTVAITPVTTAAVLRGRVLAGADGTFADKFTAAKAALDAQAGFDILTTVPANPLNPGAATDAQKSYALLLGGIANLVNDVALSSGASAPTYDMVVAVTFDLVDGQIDGQYFGSTDIPGSTATPVSLPQDLNLAEEITRFRNNNFSNFGDVAQLPSIEVTTFGNTFPTAVAVANNNGEVPQGTLGTLDGGGSTDAESGVFYSWVQTAGTTVALSDAAAAAPTFTAPTRLIGNETLSFELTAIDTLGFTAVDTVDVTVVGALSNDFYVVDDQVLGEDGVGTDVDGGGRITITDATNGVLFAEGQFPFTYVISADQTAFTITFPTPFLQDDFDEERDPDGDGQLELLLIEERVDTFTFSLVTDNTNADELTISQTGNEVVLTLDGATELQTNPLLPDVEPLIAYDIAQAQPFVIAAGDRRTLLYDSFNVISTLQNDDELFHELFEFTTFDAASNGGTGIVRDSGTTFSYSIDAAGNLVVEFSPTESAKYINLATRPTGDVVATEYNLAEPFFTGDPSEISDVRLSIPENQSITLPTTRLQAAGVYSGVLEDPQDVVENREFFVRLNPDGTGSINFDGQANTLQFFDFDGIIPFRSNFGVCWDVNANSEIVINRTFSFNIGFPNSFSSETSTALCSGLTEENTDFQFNLTVLDIVPDPTTGVETYKFFDRAEFNRCAFTPTADCVESPVLDTDNFLLRINEREVLTATPPVAFIDPVQTPDSTPITINLLANDLARELPITGAVLGRGPFNGTIDSFDPATGILVYTPDPGIRSDAIEYQAIDSAGNKSQQQITQIDINPCPSIDGQQAFFDIFTKDCNYGGLGTPGNPALTDVNLGPLPNGGVHVFNDSLVIGQDFNTNAGLSGASITQGGDGPSLNIAAGTVIAFSNPTSVLSISRGSQLNVAGTPTEPVIMTSQTDIQDKRDRENGGPGFLAYNAVEQWGGVVIQGFGRVNTCPFTGSVAGGDLALSGECHFATPTGLGHFGGDNNLDNSGSISYLQVRYGGAFVGSDIATGFALGGVGSGTSISHVQVYSTRGDGFALAGGAVDLQNIISLYAGFAGILVDYGYSGSVSNALLIQDQGTGEFCVDSAGADDEIFTPTQIDALITQGIVSKPSLTNLTCVVSGEGFPGGFGIDFINGAEGQLVDSIAFVPGPDNFNNVCIEANDQSLQAVQDGNLLINSNLFACPSRTLNQLPSLSPLDSFLVSSGNQFATLSQGTSNPPPTAGAATGNVLVEGSPLIYSPANGDLLIDTFSVPAPAGGTFYGAVQQGAGDWTQDWAFGLFPDNRRAPLWYEVPIATIPDFIPVSKATTVFLDASQSVSQNGGLTFQWTQISGAPVVLSNPTGQSTTFTSPGAGTTLTTPGGLTQVELLLTDAAGLETRKVVDVVAEASIPQDFFSATESIIPFQFNRSIEGGARISIDPATFTGEYQNFNGNTSFTWTDTDTTFTIDFGVSGGLNSAPVTSFEDVDGDPLNGQEEITRTRSIDQFVFTLVDDSSPKKIFQLSRTGQDDIFDVTNNVPVAPDVFSNELVTSSNQAVVGVGNGIPFDFFNTQEISLPTNVSTAVPTLFNPGLLADDLLTFNEDGTGFAVHKNQTFNYIQNFDRVFVTFNDGETAEYLLMFNRDDGDAVGVTYTKTDLSVTSQVAQSVKNDDFVDFGTQAFLEGIYTTNERIELDNGTFIDSNLFYRINPDGTGVLEIEIFDPATGNLDLIFTSSNGICWEFQPPNNFIWYRGQFPDEFFTGSSIPGISSCSLLNSGTPDPTLIRFQRDISLLNTSVSGDLLTFTENRSNQFNPATMTGDNTVIEFTDTFLRNFDPVLPFLGNPPIAFPDAVSAMEGVLTPFNVVMNDLQGDSTINPLTVTIVVQPKEGVATVDPATGDIEYTPNVGHSGNDFLQYRVQDMNGNESTIGTVNYTVTP